MGLARCTTEPFLSDMLFRGSSLEHVRVPSVCVQMDVPQLPTLGRPLRANSRQSLCELAGLRMAELTGDELVEVASGGQEFGKSLAEEYLEFALDDSCLLHKPLRDLRAGYGTEPGDSREGVVEELSVFGGKAVAAKDRCRDVVGAHDLGHEPVADQVGARGCDSEDLAGLGCTARAESSYNEFVAEACSAEGAPHLGIPPHVTEEAPVQDVESVHTETTLSMDGPGEHQTGDAASRRKPAACQSSDSNFVVSDTARAAEGARRHDSGASDDFAADFESESDGDNEYAGDFEA